MDLQLKPQKFIDQLREVMERTRYALAVARWEGIDGPEVRNLEEMLRRNEELLRDAHALSTSCGEAAAASPMRDTVLIRRHHFRRVPVTHERRMRAARRAGRLKSLPAEPA